MIIYRKRNTRAQFNMHIKNFTDTLKPLAAKSPFDETNHEFIYPNSTYEDHQEASHDLILLMKTSSQSSLPNKHIAIIIYNL